MRRVDLAFLVLLAACTRASRPTHVHDPKLTGPEVTWETPAGRARAILLGVGDTATIECVITMADGTQYIPLTLPSSEGFPRFRVVGANLVVRREYDLRATPEIMADDTLIQWDAERHAPARKQFWKGEVGGHDEPTWAGGPGWATR